MPFIFIYLLFMNVIAFVIMSIDKKRAIKGKWRISENSLYIFGIAGGALGAFIGMLYFHHKTKKPLFYMIYIGAMVLWSLGIYLFIANA